MESRDVMKTLHFSVAQPEDGEELEAFYQALISPAMSRIQTRVSIEPVPWEELWCYVKNKTLSRIGLDVSEVGTTWLPSLADANALRPISDAFIASIGGRSPFVPISWKSTSIGSDPRPLSVPWLLDVRVIYYWRDFLEIAGVNETTAFSTVESTCQTMERLRAAGQPGWGAATFPSVNTVYNMAPWIWAKTGDYVSEDGRRTAFFNAEALEGIRAYFQLYEYIPRRFTSFTDIQDAFRNRQIAAMIDGPWVWADLTVEPAQMIDKANIGISLTPGPPFIGGSNLIVWNHIDEDRVPAALALIHTLVSPEVQERLHQVRRMLPVREDAYRNAPYADDYNFVILGRALRKGRHTPLIPLWGHLEESLVRVFGLVCEALQHNDLKLKDGMLERHLAPLARRFDRILEIL